MSHHPSFQGRDKLLAQELYRICRSVGARAEHPKLRSTALTWAGLIRETFDPMRAYTNPPSSSPPTEP